MLDFALDQKDRLCYYDGKTLDGKIEIEIERCWYYVLCNVSKRISILS